MNIGRGIWKNFFDEVEIIVSQIPYIPYIHAEQIHSKTDKVLIGIEEVKRSNDKLNNLSLKPLHQLDQLLALLLDLFFL